MHNPTNYEVLVIEDEDTTRHLVAHVLRDAGYRVAEVVDSNRGLEALLSDRTSFDMVVLDMQMPTMNGLQVARAMRRDERVSDTPLLAVTALAHADDLTRILRAGCDAYLAKPFAMAEVCESSPACWRRERREPRDSRCWARPNAPSFPRSPTASVAPAVRASPPPSAPPNVAALWVCDDPPHRDVVGPDRPRAHRRRLPRGRPLGGTHRAANAPAAHGSGRVTGPAGDRDVRLQPHQHPQVPGPEARPRRRRDDHRRRGRVQRPAHRRRGQRVQPALRSPRRLQRDERRQLLRPAAHLRRALPGVPRRVGPRDRAGRRVGARHRPEGEDRAGRSRRRLALQPAGRHRHRRAPAGRGRHLQLLGRQRPEPRARLALHAEDGRLRLRYRRQRHPERHRHTAPDGRAGPRTRSALAARRWSWTRTARSSRRARGRARWAA